ncbi:uncharacterized protein BX663DRAFT_531243 [Cokeromyces recurvatus]|uniref:uncharacterized protein n=1 Tax=Cokeromyces recurvatus TaxID=90255 RepID=UPI002220A8AE|nr:uncharacterized protein BX663DRAFT_531243 [Cokeromyces recurvatus]KAI7902709.1 hypothetical protein BX663DRAFT_531243 [Cokeromyces recurvatus]
MDIVKVAQKTGGSTDKKGRVSLNHLLSFSFPERQRHAPIPNYRKTKVTSYQPFNKERFINANFRFILNPIGDYIYQLADPDANFDWDTIEQVLISSSEAQSCPICLSPPTAPRVTKCGHIYCLPCILHYLELRENRKSSWRKCPICWESIYEADLKPVRITKPFAISEHVPTSGQTASLSCGVREGDRIEMALIQRSSHSTLAFPISDTWPLPENVVSNYIKPDTPLIPWHFTPGAMTFARFMLGSPDYFEGEYRRDRIELNEALSDANGWGSTEEIPFIEKSLTLVSNKIKQLRQQRTKELELAIQTSEMIFEAVAKYSRKHGKAPLHDQPFKDKKEEEGEEEKVPEAYRHHQSHQGGVDFIEETKTPTTTRQRQPLYRQHSVNTMHDSMPTQDYYFYQAVDGQHVYLHPLDIRILKHEFGDYHQFPHRLQALVTNVQESTLTEELRKKCKYLSHLPLACDVTFLEIDVKDIVSSKTIEVYNQELVARVKKRKDKERREEQKRRQAESKQKLQVEKEQEAERQMLENDPFFNMYRPPLTAEENEEHLSQALAESVAAISTEENHSPRTTVWGTRQITPQKDEILTDWADHIIVTKNHRKKKGKRR